MRLGFVLTLALGCPAVAPAGVVVLGNYTAAEVAYTLTDHAGRPTAGKVAAFQVAPVAVNGPVDLTFPTKGANRTLRLDPYHAYLFLPDPKKGRRLEAVQMPGESPADDAKPAEVAPPVAPAVVPVYLLVDDADVRLEPAWKAAVTARLKAAERVIAAHAPIRFQIVELAKWKSDPTSRTAADLLADFEARVTVRPGAVMIGFASRKLPDGDVGFGSCRGLPTQHVLVRETRPANEADRVEVLAHNLALALGATGSPDPESVMRPKPGDGKAARVGFKMRFDPLNTLALNIWADELRRGGLIGRPADASAANQARLKRVYQALLEATPGDRLAAGLVAQLDGVMAGPAPVPVPVRPAEPKPKANPAPAAPRPPMNPAPGGPGQPSTAKRDEAARGVVRAVVERARRNVGPDALTGDALARAYLTTIGDAVVGVPDESRVPAFLIGIAVALDDTGTLADDPSTAAGVRNVETPAERADRLKVLGNPTLRGRRDLLRRFAAGCGAGELLGVQVADEVAVGRAQFDLHAPGGFGFPAVAAEFAGARFALAVTQDVSLINRVREGFHPDDWLPDTAGLRDGLSGGRYEADFGDPEDDRFVAVLADIRGRIRRLPGHRRD